MREELKRLENKAVKYRATFERFGSKGEGRDKERTVLLNDIYTGSKLVTDPVWAELTPDLEYMGTPLTTGLVLEFTAVAKPYVKDPSFRNTAIPNQELDTGLTEIKNVKVL